MKERSASKAANYEGLPPDLSLQYARDWVSRRVSARRFKHISGVAKVAAQIAQAADCDQFLAELAGWLHDACKEFKEKDLLLLSQKYNLPLDSVTRSHPHLMHGPVAAATVKVELGITNQPLLEAISQHTLGAVPMTRLSKVVFLADCLDETRPEDYTRPIWNALQIDQDCNLDRAVVVACDLNIEHLLATGKPIHPLTVEVRNYYISGLND